MEYRVEIAPRAKRDLDKLYTWAASGAPLRGPLWFDGLTDAILSLARLPERCAVVPALSSQSRSVRRLVFGKKRNSYRVYYTVFGEVVRVVHIRHSARREPKRL